MRYRCPICSFEFIGGGFCPSPYHVATMMEELPEQEDNREMKSIEYKGNLHRFGGQKTAQLLAVQQIASKEIDPMTISHVGREIDTKGVRSYLLLTFVGNRGIAFQDILNFGTARQLSLKADIGTWFPIDSPATEEQVEIELKAQEVKE